jgi:hypothetical protein
MDLKEWAKLQESLLISQLRVVRQFLKEDKEHRFRPRGKGKSQMNVVYDVLLSAQKPLHITEIIEKAKKDFNVALDRDSLVSAITKKVKSGRMFKKVEANTFTVLDSSSDNTS